MRHWWWPELTGRAALLLPISWLFGALTALRRALYHAGLFQVTRLRVPVIIVGNLTAGGSGKTPLVIALVEALRAAGYTPGVISRGYGGAHAHRSILVPLEVAGNTHPALCGDEPLLIHRRAGTPTFVSVNRPHAAQALLNAHPGVNVIISDDGLQHYALAREVEIAVFDARGPGNRRLLPAGPLREPLSRARNVTAIVHNISSAFPERKILENGSWQGFPASFAMRFTPLPCYRLVNPSDTCAANQLGALGKLAAVAGIGDPARFFASLRALGLTIAEHPFPDHHAFTREDLAAIDADTIVMTEKDALKCVEFNDTRLWVLPVEARIDLALVNLILEKLRGHQAA